MIRESSDFDNTSDDDELERLHTKDLDLFAKQMIKSKHKTD